MVNGANDAFAADTLINKLDHKAEGMLCKFADDTKWKMLCMLEVSTPIQRKLDKLDKFNRYLQCSNGKYRILSG